MRSQRPRQALVQHHITMGFELRSLRFKAWALPSWSKQECAQMLKAVEGSDRSHMQKDRGIEWEWTQTVEEGVDGEGR